MDGTECATSLSLSASSSPSAPPVSFQHAEQAVQTTESVFEGNIDSNCCRVCGEGLCENTLWVGCEEKDCSFWWHAWCMGVTAYRKYALKNLKFYCPQHLTRNKKN